MSLTPTNHRLGVQVFLDDRDFTSNLGDSAPDPRSDYGLLGPALAEAALEIVDHTADLDYRGILVYVAGRNGADSERINHIGKQAGAFVTADRRSGPRRSALPRSETDRGALPDLDAGAERLADESRQVQLAVDLMRFASFDNRGIGVLASSNLALIPAVEALKSAGFKVVHAAFPPRATDLSRKCWGSIPIPPVLRSLRRADGERAT